VAAAVGAAGAGDRALGGSRRAAQARRAGYLGRRAAARRDGFKIATIARPELADAALSRAYFVKALDLKADDRRALEAPAFVFLLAPGQEANGRGTCTRRSMERRLLCHAARRRSCRHRPRPRVVSGFVRLGRV
jgi:hypothetical protein